MENGKNSREYYYNLIEKGQKAIEGILDVAKEGQRTNKLH